MKASIVGWNLLVYASLLLSVAVAQPPNATTVRPGGSFRGRFIGFVPLHERTPSVSPLRADDVIAWSPSQENLSIGEVEPASLEEPIPAYAVSSDCATCDAPCEGLCEAPSAMNGYNPGYQVPLLWGRADYLLWWTNSMATPALGTTSVAGTPQDRAALLGDPGTAILFGSTGVNDEARSGGRVTLGRWFDAQLCQGLDVTYVWLAEGSESFLGSGEDFPILGRPFFNTQTGEQDARLISYPELVDGTLNIFSATEFHSWEAVLRRNVSQWTHVQTDYFIGYRYARLDDLVQVNESSVSLSGPTLDATLRLGDKFQTKNDFHGGELGIRVLRQTSPCWSIELTGQVALGSTSSTTVVDGQTEVTAADGSRRITEAGLLVQETNAGTYEHDTFSTLSEGSITLRRQFACGLAARFGYTFLYWSDVLRAGEQIDVAVNPTQIPPGTLEGEPRPSLPNDTTGFWAQGLHFGLDYRY